MWSYGHRESTLRIRRATPELVAFVRSLGGRPQDQFTFALWAELARVEQ